MRAMCLSVASLGLAALVAAPRTGAAEREVTYITAAKVTAAFVKGMPLVEKENYKVHASRREAAGQVEIHTKDTDIIYFLTGTATFVTGGTTLGSKTSAPEEIRGSSIDGGETHTLRPGDVIIVPNGTPHWFKEVPAPITYYVVKVRAAGDAR